MNIHEIERFELPSMKSYRKRKPDYQWVWGVVAAVILAVVSFAFFWQVAGHGLSALVSEKAYASEMTNEEVCANADRFSNHAEVKEYCYGDS